MKLAIHETVTIEVHAIDYYSTAFIETAKDEVYSFLAASLPKWKDWMIPATADGAFNFMLLDRWKRVRGKRCFTLCGTIGKDEQNHFAIGSKLDRWQISVPGNLHFFANDHYNPVFYKNNTGYILLQIMRNS